MRREATESGRCSLKQMFVVGLTGVLDQLWALRGSFYLQLRKIVINYTRTQC